MNKLNIIGNLTKDPELRSTRDGTPVCSFTVAVNRRRKEGQPQEADYFRVTAWRGLAELCNRYLTKGRKVAVSGPVSVSTYTGNDGSTRASLEVTADDVEFLSARDGIETPPAGAAAPVPLSTQRVEAAGYVEINPEDELPF